MASRVDPAARTPSPVVAIHGRAGWAEQEMTQVVEHVHDVGLGPRCDRACVDVRSGLRDELVALRGNRFAARCRSARYFSTRGRRGCDLIWYPRANRLRYGTGATRPGRRQGRLLPAWLWRSTCVAGLPWVLAMWSPRTPLSSVATAGDRSFLHSWLVVLCRRSAGRDHSRATLLCVVKDQRRGAGTPVMGHS
jgi:hypothetical protein